MSQSPHHGHSSHGRRRDSKREHAALLTSTFLNPVLPGIQVPPVVPHASTSPASQHGTGFFSPLSTGTYPQHPKQQQQQQHQPIQRTGSPHVPTSSSPVALWGEAEGAVKNVVGHKQPLRPLLGDGWMAGSVTCSVPKLYQPLPSPPHTMTIGEHAARVLTAMDHPRDSRGHNLILQSIDLQRHVQELRQLISTARDSLPSMNPTTPMPPIPTNFWTPPSKVQRYHAPSSLVPPDHELPDVPLDQTALYLLLRKSAATVAVHVGYESSSSLALDTMTDLLGDFLSRITKVMRIHADQKAEHGAVGFQDVMDRSLHECGIEGKTALESFWRTCVKGPVNQLHQTAVELREEYQRLTEPPGGKPSGTEGKPISDPASWSARDPLDFRLLSPWLSVAHGNAAGDGAEEEISLDAVMQHANLDNVSLVRTPDLGAPVTFSQLSEGSSQETEGFTSLVVEGPPRKRLKTMSLSTE